MRLFLSLCTLAIVANAKPQGYNYATGVSGILNGGGGGSSSSSSSFLPATSHAQHSSYGGLSGGSHTAGGSTGTIGFGNLGGGSYGTDTNAFTSGQSAGNFGFGNGLIGSNSYQQQQQQQQGFEAPIIHKQFITIAAPEDHENLEKTKHFVIGRPQKNYRVVFIKAPSSSSANVKLSAEYAPQEEKTVIYVLSKKDSSLEVNDIATPAPTVPSKPEVFFIKYKTDEEAQHAQRQIQAEYDKIEGTSEHTDGGVAPQQSVVGILDSVSGGAAINNLGGGSLGGGSLSGGSLGGGSFSGGSLSGGSLSGGSLGGGSFSGGSLSGGSLGGGSLSGGSVLSGATGTATYQSSNGDATTTGTIAHNQSPTYLPPSGH